MKNIYSKSFSYKIGFIIIFALFLFGNIQNSYAQVRVNFNQRPSVVSPDKLIYNIKGDFTMIGNTCLTPQNYSPTTNNNGQNILYVDTDGNSSTWNSSSSTLVFSTENGAIPSCSNVVYAGLYWTGKSSPNETFTVTRNTGTQTQTVSVNDDLNVIHNQNIANTNYSLSISRGGINGNRYPIYTFTNGTNTYAFTFFNRFLLAFIA